MNTQQKALLTAAFDALGPERVIRGLRATGHTWSDCFLALAIAGEPEVVARELQKRWRKEHFISTRLRVRLQAITETVRAWDHEQDEFRSLAAEWLELNRTAPAPQAVAST